MATGERVHQRVEDTDQRIVFRGLDWWQFEAMLAARGERSGARMAYLEGDLEIMSPSREHESLNRLLGRLLEAYAEERGLVLECYGSMTLRNALRQRGVEPDTCYAVGAAKEQPDLAIEICWTHGGLPKLEVYRGLGVREVWTWESGRLTMHALRGDQYEEVAGSELLPGATPGLLERFLGYETQTEAVRALREALRKG